METNQMQTQSLQGSWAKHDIEQLAMALTFAYKTQTTYKEPLDLDTRVRGWQFVLEEDFTIEQVLYGLKQYMKTNTNMPVPANVLNILNPQKPKISTAEYVQACKWQERQEDWSPYTHEAGIIQAYKKQESEVQEDFQIECEKIAQIVEQSVKRIGAD